MQAAMPPRPVAILHVPRQTRTIWGIEISYELRATLSTNCGGLDEFLVELKSCEAGRSSAQSDIAGVSVLRTALRVPSRLLDAQQSSLVVHSVSDV